MLEERISRNVMETKLATKKEGNENIDNWITQDIEFILKPQHHWHKGREKKKGIIWKQKGTNPGGGGVTWILHNQAICKSVCYTG